MSTLPAAVQSIIKHYTVDRRSLSILSTVARGGSTLSYGHTMYYIVCSFAVCVYTEDDGAVVKGQWSVNSVDPVGGNKGVMMKMLTGTFQHEYFVVRYVMAFLTLHQTSVLTLSHSIILRV